MQLRDMDKVLIDVETTGIDKEKHQVLEVGMLILRNDNIVDKLEIGIKYPEYTISSRAMEINKIDIVKHEKEAVTQSEAIDTIIDFLRKNKVQKDGFIPLGQNVQFDIGFLQKLFLSQSKNNEFKELISYRTIDVMQIAILRNLEGKISLESQSLDKIMEALQIKITDKRHRALEDCYLEYEVYKRLLELK